MGCALYHLRFVDSLGLVLWANCVVGKLCCGPMCCVRMFSTCPITLWPDPPSTIGKGQYLATTHLPVSTLRGNTWGSFPSTIGKGVCAPLSTLGLCPTGTVGEVPSTFGEREAGGLPACFSYLCTGLRCVVGKLCCGHIVLWAQRLPAQRLPAQRLSVVLWANCVVGKILILTLILIRTLICQ